MGCPRTFFVYKTSYFFSTPRFAPANFYVISEKVCFGEYLTFSDFLKVKHLRIN